MFALHQRVGVENAPKSVVSISSSSISPLLNNFIEIEYPFSLNVNSSVLFTNLVVELLAFLKAFNSTFFYLIRYNVFVLNFLIKTLNLTLIETLGYPLTLF